jgi:elongation factor G
VIANKLVPVLVGTSLRNKGVQPLLNAIVRYLPNPLEVRPVKGVDPKTGDPVTRPADPKAPFSALAFKIVTDPYVGRLAYVRVYSGSLKAGSRVYNVNRGRSERASRLLQMQADQRNEIDVCVAGDIVAIVGLKQTFTGETLSDAGNTLLLETIDFPDPVINIAIEAPSRADQDRLHDILNKLAEEDPTFRIHFDTESGQTLISGMGELHLEIIVERIRRDFNLPCKVGSPQVALRETITKPAKAEGRYIQQTGGHGHYAVVWLEVEPNERGAGFVFENRITGGVIPRQFIPAVERGVTMSIENGVLAGYPIVDVKVALVHGKFHDVDSSSTDFEVAASFAFKAACEKAGPILLEPIMQVEASAPKEYLGNLVHDFGRRRGDVARLDTSGEQIHKVDALVPLREMIGYATDLRSMTTGRGIFTMQLDHHAPTPEDVTRRILGDYFP